MNSAGHINYCPVCREAAILRIYSYVNPIDAFDPPNTQEVEVTAGSPKVLAVTPMKPKSKTLDVAWYVEPIDAAAADARARATDDRAGGEPPPRRLVRPLRGRLARTRRIAPSSTSRPWARRTRSGPTRKGKDGVVENVFRLGQPQAGPVPRHRRRRGQDPSVLLDPKHLLEERKTWWVKVVAPAAAGK